MIPALLIMLFSSELVAPPAVIGPPLYVVDFEMNGAPYRMPVPDAYCVPKITPASYMKELERNGQIISPQAFFLRCDEKGQPLADHEFLYVKYLKGQKLRYASRAEFIAATAPMAQEKFDDIYEPDTIADRVESRMAHENAAKLEIKEMRAFPLGHNESCIFLGLRSSIKIEKTGENISMLMLNCTTVIDGNLLIVDLSSEIERDTDLAILKQKLSKVVDSVTARIQQANGN